jgi:hypothetical protein
LKTRVTSRPPRPALPRRRHCDTGGAVARRAVAGLISRHRQTLRRSDLHRLGRLVTWPYRWSASTSTTARHHGRSCWSGKTQVRLTRGTEGRSNMLRFQRHVVISRTGKTSGCTPARTKRNRPGACHVINLASFLVRFTGKLSSPALHDVRTVELCWEENSAGAGRTTRTR